MSSSSQDAKVPSREQVLLGHAAANQKLVAFFLCAMYFVFAVAHRFMLPSDVSGYMILGAIATAAITIGIGAAGQKKILPLRWAHIVNGIFAALILANSVAHLYLTGRIDETTNFMLLVLAIGSVFYSWPWFWGMLALTTASWIEVTRAFIGTYDWWHYAFAFLVSCWLAGLYHLLRVRSALQMERTRQAEQEEKKKVEQALVELEQGRAELLGFFDDASDLIQSVDRADRFYYVNRKWREVLGYSEHEAKRLTTANVVHPDSIQLWEDTMCQALAGMDVRDIEIQLLTKSGQPVWVEGRPVLHVQDCLTIGTRTVFRDLSSRKRAEEAIMYKATHDQLTRLPNRGLLEDRFLVAKAQASRASQQFAVLFMDLDGFKQCNDEFGHEAGDFVLTHVAGLLKRCTRLSDTVARLGGDEFVILAQGVKAEQDAITVAENILKGFSPELVFQGNTLRLGVSIGISFFPGHGVVLEDLLRTADKAMYTAKQAGKNCHRMAPLNTTLPQAAAGD
jgi:diguanylate cyclase (GGDEF)-like protein/PAS domain S-box-containing protein